MLTANSDVKDSFVVCQSSQGLELHATLLRLTRFAVVFEIYNPGSLLRLSEVLSDFRIIVRDQRLYSGRGVVRNLVHAGLTVICEATLDEASWMDLEFSPGKARNGNLRAEFAAFVEEWQKLYKVAQEYKVIIADMQSFFMDLRLWLDQLELGVRASPAGDRLKLEQDVAEQVAAPIIPSVNALFEKFEAVAEHVEEELKPAHRSYMRRQLHPLVLSSPFAHRAFYKPLGYAGDYELVNMMLRNAQEGASLFAKIVNTWFLRQVPAQAHRNRINYLAGRLWNETLRGRRKGRDTRVFSVACGPAQEVQKFLLEEPLSECAQFILLDFNEETLRYAQAAFRNIESRCGRAARVQLVRKSVNQILKESSRTLDGSFQNRYDVVYCAGLFDYLSDQVCRRLINVMYEWVAAGGLLIATNVEPSNPLRHGMEHLLDWHLIYRTASQLREFKPPAADPDSVSVLCDETGVNLFLEIRKPAHG